MRAPVTDGGAVQAAAAGVLVGAAGVAVGDATAALLRQRLTPVDAVREAVIEATPGRVAVALVHLVGDLDKPLLLVGTLLVLLGLCAAAGLQARSSRWLGHAVLLVTGAVAAAAALTRPGEGVPALLPVVAGVATWLLLLRVLVPYDGARAQAAQPRDGARRAFLLRAGAVAVAAVAVAAAGRAVEAARRRLALPVSDPVVPVGADLDVAGLGPWQVPNAEFYRIDTAVAVPVVGVDEWRLRVHGLVEREVVVTYEELLDRRLTEAWVTLCCVSNEVGGDLVGNAWWSGVRVADLLAEAGPRPGADAVLQTSDDGWTCGTPLAALTDGRDALLAVAMNGEPLPIEHGFPVRMVVPGLYGFVSATKWLVDLEVTRFEEIDAFWTTRGWAEQAPVRTQSRIDVPRAHTRVEAGAVRVAGVAWAQQTGVAAVEVRLDGDPWVPVELGTVPSVDTWVQWAGTVAVTPGTHTLSVRATDRSGYVQTAVRRDVVPDGATGWHTVEFTAE